MFYGKFTSSGVLVYVLIDQPITSSRLLCVCINDSTLMVMIGQKTIPSVLWRVNLLLKTKKV